MTEKEQQVYDKLLDYGHQRFCDCYHGMCLVIPEKIVYLMSKRIAKIMEVKEK